MGCKQANRCGFGPASLREKTVSKLVRVLAAWAMMAGLPGREILAQSPTEYEVKAAFLYNFAKFVEWPGDSPGEAQDTISLCVVGKDPFGSVLDETVKGKIVNKRGLVVKRFERGEDARGCQIVFISSSEKKRLRSTLESLKSTGVLTVGDSEGFAQQGGVINFVLEDNRVHFEINLDAAERARLKISSKLLSLAKIVRDEGQGGKG